MFGAIGPVNLHFFEETRPFSDSLKTLQRCVVYFDQLTGALHTVCWLKLFVFALKQIFSYFSITNGKRERKAAQKHDKTCIISTSERHVEHPFAGQNTVIPKNLGQV